MGPDEGIDEQNSQYFLFCADTLSILLRVMNTICDTNVVISYMRHHATFAAHTSDWLCTARDVLAWCRAIIEAIAWPKRARTRGDIWHSGAPAKTLTFRSMSRIPYLRHRDVVAAHAPDRRRTTIRVSAWCRAAIEAIV